MFQSKLKDFTIYRISSFVSNIEERVIVKKQSSTGVLRKRCSENMQQIYRKTPMPKFHFNSNFIEMKLVYGCSPVNLLHIFKTPFAKNTYGGLPLIVHWVYNLVWSYIRGSDEIQDMTLRTFSLGRVYRGCSWNSPFLISVIDKKQLKLLILLWNASKNVINVCNKLNWFYFRDMWWKNVVWETESYNFIVFV